MLCTNCGKSMDENVTFCPECGTKVIPIPTTSTPPQPTKQNRSTIIILTILLLLVIALGIAIWHLYNNKKRDINDDWKETEATAEEEPSPAPTEMPTPEPTEIPTPEPTGTPQKETSENAMVWTDLLADIDTSIYEKYTVYTTEMEESGLYFTDTQTILASGDIVVILIESTTIDFSAFSQEEIDIYAKAYDEVYAPLLENTPRSVILSFGLNDTIYRIDIRINLLGADLQELVEAGYITVLSGSSDTLRYISYEQTCLALEENGYTLVK